MVGGASVVMPGTAATRLSPCNKFMHLVVSRKHPPPPLSTQTQVTGEVSVQHIGGGWCEDSALPPYQY